MSEMEIERDREMEREREEMINTHEGSKAKCFPCVTFITWEMPQVKSFGSLFLCR